MTTRKEQLTFLDEIIVDNFAGGGGASTGIELAAGRPVSIAINHDINAILMHKTNHPFTEHYQASVWDVDPVEVCRGRPVGLAWFSPDCKHFSKAKGKALVDRKIRGLAWIVLRWAAKVRPRVIMLENVEEFQTWGPVRRGKPIKSKAGFTFRKWLSQLTELGYKVEYRELVAADFGAPTSRKRFVLIARCDGLPIRWPERTHAPKDHPDVLSGKYKPWRSAAEIIGWSLPTYSVFKSKEEIKEKYGVNAIRPLADNTMRRIIRGVDKFTIKSGKPFIVPTGYGERKGQAPRVHDLNEPLPTVVSTVKANLCEPKLSPFIVTNNTGNAPHDVKDPLPTVTTGDRCILAAPCLIQYHSEQSEKVRGQGLDDPLMTVDGANRYGLASAQLTEWYGNAREGIDLADPLSTVTAKDREALTLAHIAEFKGQDKGQAADAPLRTITAGDGEFGVVTATVVRYRDNVDLGYWPKIRELLNRYCGYELKEDEILLLCIFGCYYFIYDIGLRMLIPRELYSAQGFPEDYVIDRDYLGREYKRNQQVARCGNAVCPPMAYAVVKANMPEWDEVVITNMAQFAEYVAVRR